MGGVYGNVMAMGQSDETSTVCTFYKSPYNLINIFCGSLKCFVKILTTACFAKHKLFNYLFEINF